MLRATFGAGLVLALLATPLSVAAQNALTPEQWREDLRVLARELPARHRSAFDPVKSGTTREAFERAVAELDARIPALADHEVVVGLARLAAMLRDGHTRLTLPQDPAVGFSRAHTSTEPPSDSSLYMRHLPVKLELFSDGLFVRASTPEHRGLIGAKVLEIGRMSADSALEAVRPVVHYDNEMGFKHLAPTRLTIPEVLHAQRVTGDRGRVRLLLEERSGGQREVVLAPVPLFDAPRFIEAREVAAAPALLAERQPDAWYWLEYLPEDRTVYVQVNRVGSTEEEPMIDFARRIGRIVHDSAAARVVLDLRFSPGGDNSTMRPLLHVLSTDDAINRFGRLVVLTGRATFSAAQTLVNELEYASQALFMGEPPGNAPSAFGDSRKLRLPNSGLTLRASTRYHRDRGPESRTSTDVVIPVALSSSDYLANRDPVLEAALAFRAPQDPRALARLIFERAGWAPAQRVCFAHLADTRLQHDAVEAGLTECGAILMDIGRPEVAVQWFRMNLNHLGNSARVHLGLAQALAATGEPDAARDALGRALALAPDDTDVRELAEQLRSRAPQ